MSKIMICSCVRKLLRVGLKPRLTSLFNFVTLLFRDRNARREVQLTSVRSVGVAFPPSTQTKGFLVTYGRDCSSSSSDAENEVARTICADAVDRKCCC